MAANRGRVRVLCAAIGFAVLSGGPAEIAAATGGGYFELTSTNDLPSTFARVADELHHQYALGFAPATLDGKMHSLEVRLGGTGMTARARKSYLARNER